MSPVRASLALSALVALAGCTTDFSLDQLSTDATVSTDAAVDAGSGACGASGQPCCPATAADAGGTCASSLVCNGESCVACPEGLAACAGRCVDLRVSPVHCGACGVACAEGEQCVGGGCDLVCPPGLTNCGGRCVRLTDDPTHCHAAARLVRVALQRRDGVQAGPLRRGPLLRGLRRLRQQPRQRLRDRPRHHGGPLRRVRPRVRDAQRHAHLRRRRLRARGVPPGLRRLRPRPGQRVRDRHPGERRELRRLRHGLPRREGVRRGRVRGGADGVRAAGALRRWGPCVDTATDPNNCGACGRSCGFANATPSCASGACALGACNTGFANCDGAPMNGCEVNTASSLNHCGGCAQRCDGVQNAARVCQGGRCDYTACEMGFGDCDNDRANGCEANLRASVAHCGGCGRACSLAHATPRCDGGACRVQSCEAGGPTATATTRTGAR
ncbi:MAG: hypothetical protein R3A52_07550 [Polyangiales bacterium]